MVNRQVFMLWGATGYMFEQEQIEVAAGASDSPRARAHRWTSYLVARLALAQGTLRLQNTIYVQPRFDRRVLDEFEAMAKVTDVLYDSRPPTEVVPLDLRLSTTVRLSF